MSIKSETLVFIKNETIPFFKFTQFYQAIPVLLKTNCRHHFFFRTNLGFGYFFFYKKISEFSVMVVPRFCMVIYLLE